MCVRARVYVYVCACVCARACVRTCVCVCARTHACLWVHACDCARVFVVSARARKHVFTLARKGHSEIREVSMFAQSDS